MRLKVWYESLIRLDASVNQFDQPIWSTYPRTTAGTTIM